MTARILVLCALAALAGCGASSQPKTTSTAPAKSTSPAGCRAVSAPKPKGQQHLRPSRAKVPAVSTVTLQTNCGAITITLAAGRAPKTTAAFAGLVKRGFFDGLTFHRIVPGFVIQGGDPLGTGEGGPGYTVVEKPPSSLRYTPGVVAMAKTQNDPSGASGSQFFIVTGAQAESLPPDYALLGRVTGGMTAAKAIERVPANPNGMPSTPIVISKATLRTG